MGMTRKIFAAFTAIVVMTIVAVGVFASPASAAASGPCYAVGSFSFRNQKTTSVLTEIHVFHSTNCTGGEIADGQASYSNGSITLGATDTGCDNIGIVVYVHGYSRASTSCHDPGQYKTVPYSSIGSPKNFWVTVHGNTNSDALALPH